ncbi:proton myo-inositol cotransporter-like isoform X2 [Tigriopus californicus]|uniref:proton myo-inositol cotransporter-like isoform X2 n=1 Tax=Tigriopus californicus TaxID=6832 RepID=UPI0027DA12AD|nr:proton myo-inositol cotransporter-like isoform X2 [Tigriopus californicus]
MVNIRLFALTFLSGIGGFLFGYDTGVISGAMLLIEEDPRIHPTTLWKELIVSATVGAALLCSLIGGPLCERWGRKPVILLSSGIFTVGALVMGIANSREVLLVGRIIVGAGIGLASMSVPIYISESAPSNLRGFLVSCNVLCITGGQFIASCVCGAFSTMEYDGWKYMLGLSGVPAVIQLIGFAFMPESPRWLLAQGQTEKGRLVLETIRNDLRDPDFMEAEFEEIIRAVEEEKRFAALNTLRVIKQQIAGINTVMYYSAKILSMAGFSNNSQAIWISAGVASINFLCTFIGLFLVERMGRRKLVLVSLLGVVVSLAFLGVGFQLSNIYSPEITFLNPNIAEDACSDFQTCGSCTNQKLCGFCYLDDPSQGSVINGSCLTIEPEAPDFSAHGRCSSANQPSLDYILFAPDYCPSNVAWLTVLGLCSYLFFFAPGMGPMPWTINSEIYPLWARSTANSIATAFNWLLNLIISMTFLSLTEAITKEGAFYLYTGVASLGLVMFFLILPETKNKPLEEVEMLFAKPWSWRPRG